MVILDDLQRMPGLLRAWQKIGLPGPTIPRSARAYRTTPRFTRVGLGALDRLFEAEEAHRRTLLVAVEGDELLEQAMAETERVMGGFDRPDSGLLLDDVAQSIISHADQPILVARAQAGESR
jgi:hypothetical protein